MQILKTISELFNQKGLLIVYHILYFFTFLSLLANNHFFLLAVFCFSLLIQIYIFSKTFLKKISIFYFSTSIFIPAYFLLSNYALKIVDDSSFEYLVHFMLIAFGIFLVFQDIYRFKFFKRNYKSAIEFLSLFDKNVLKLININNNQPYRFNIFFKDNSYKLHYNHNLNFILFLDNKPMKNKTVNELIQNLGKTYIFELSLDDFKLLDMMDI